jgi:DNA-binding protein Fis
MNWELATKKQLLQIALNEDCPVDDKYQALRELQLRWMNKLLPDLVLLYGQGLNCSQIALETGLDPHTVRNKLKQFGIYKKRVSF